MQLWCPLEPGNGQQRPDQNLLAAVAAKVAYSAASVTWCNRLSVAPFVLPSAAKPKVIGRDFHASQEIYFFFPWNEMGTIYPRYCCSCRRIYCNVLTKKVRKLLPLFYLGGGDCPADTGPLEFVLQCFNEKRKMPSLSDLHRSLCFFVVLPRWNLSFSKKNLTSNK